MSEHDEQVAFFKWCECMKAQYPVLAHFYAIPNGGKRHVSVALKLKEEGVKSGVLDTHLPVGRGNYIGLWIEFKFGRNKTSSAQDEWIDFLRDQGHRVEIAYEWQEAAQYTLEYLRLNDAIPFA